MCLTKEIIFLLFTYHQVNPWYLHSITCLNEKAGGSYLRFGAFRSQDCLKSHGPALQYLGRSGCHYQMSFRLHTVTLQKFGRQHHTAAVYHQFDVTMGKSLWIITSPLTRNSENRQENNLWNAVRKCINQPRGRGRLLVSEEAHERFESSLHIVIAVAEWSVGDCDSYVHDLQQRLEHLVSLTRWGF